MYFIARQADRCKIYKHRVLFSEDDIHRVLFTMDDRITWSITNDVFLQVGAFVSTHGCSIDEVTIHLKPKNESNNSFETKK